MQVKLSTTTQSLSRTLPSTGTNLTFQEKMVSYLLSYKLYRRFSAINMLRDKSPGTFVVRDSNSFPGAFGLALKVSKPPEGVPLGDGTELVRHFLIEPSPKGVKLKGCNNEPVFGTLAALVYQHSITPMALPCRLILPEYDPASTPEHLNAAQALLEQGAGELIYESHIPTLINLFSL